MLKLTRNKEDMFISCDKTYEIKMYYIFENYVVK